MYTFIYSPDHIDGQYITISDVEANHAVSVLRLGKGDRVRLIDGSGVAHICEIADASKKAVSCRLIKSIKNSGESRLTLTLAVGLSTQSKFDLVVEKGTEAGVRSFVPLLTEKGKVKLGDTAAIRRKMARWDRVCRAAVKQSNRSLFPTIAEPTELGAYIAGLDAGSSVLFHPDGDSMDLAAVLGGLSSEELTVIVGPESGFSPGEVRKVREHGIPIISAGDRILRTETAGIILPALLIYQYDQAKALA